MALRKFPEAELTENAVEDMTKGLHVNRPVFQVLGFCYCDTMCSGPIYNCTQRSVRLSDGDKYFDAYLVSKYQDPSNHLAFQKHAIVQLVDFNTEHVLCGKYTVLIFEGRLIQDGADLGVIGNPTSLRPQKDPKWYADHEEDGFYSRLDEVVTLLLRYRDKELDQVEYHKQTLTAAFCNPRCTENQELHIHDGLDALNDSRDHFITASYNPPERLTPYMVMHIEEGRNYISPTVIETAFREEIWRNPQYIQVVDYRRVTDKKNETYLHLFLNDGIHMTTGILCPYSNLCRQGLKKFSLLEILKYSFMAISDQRKCLVIHEVGELVECDCVIRFTKVYPEYRENTAYEADSTLQSLTKFAELMEREGVLAYGTRFDKRAEKPKPFRVKRVKKSAANSLPQPEAVISVGAVETLAHGGEFKNPILQILLFKKILHVGEDTYAVLISDGYDIMTGFLEKELFKETPKSCFLPFTMVQILKYSFMRVLSYRNTLLIHKIGYHIPPTSNQKSPIGRPLYYTYNVEPTPGWSDKEHNWYWEPATHYFAKHISCAITFLCSLEEVEKLPSFCPRQTIEIIAAQRLYKQEIKRHNLMLNMSANRERLARNAVVESESKALEESDRSENDASTELANVIETSYAPIERAPAMDGFCKYADLWHEKATRTTRLPDGRLIVRRPVTQRVPYHFSITHEMSSKLRNKIIVKR